MIVLTHGCLVPSEKTIKRYGLDGLDWSDLAYIVQGACPICRTVPRDHKFVIDHKHVKGWKKMKPTERRRHVRGLLCNRCNWQFLRRGMTAEIATNLAEYLNSYEKAEKSASHFPGRDRQYYHGRYTRHSGTDRGRADD